MTAHVVNFDTIEESKENIAPTPRGRSAVALAKAFEQVSSTDLSPQDIRNAHACTRTKFEHDIASSSDLDDPLEVWLRYIKWTDETFPAGQSTESGIARLLERCTAHFKNDKQYKSDPRYLRVWLAYSTYSESPLEIFRFLQCNDIGQDLALYYEEYAAVLEKMNRKRKADEIFQIGLLREARPIDRLRRRYAEFQQRLETSPPDPQEPSTPPPPLRKILGASHAPTAAAAGASSLAGISRPRPKMQVFTDTEDPEPRPGSGGWESIGTLAQRKKENTMAAKPWAGEKMPMRVGSSATVASSTGERLVVFRDEAQTQQHHKRNHEHVAVNLETIYVDSEEFSFEELLAKKRGIYGITSKHERPTSPAEAVFKPLFLTSAEAVLISKDAAPAQSTAERSALSPQTNHKSLLPKSSPGVSFAEFKSNDEDEVVSVPIRDEDSTPRKPVKRRPSPTVNTKAALDDIIDIFSQPLRSQQELDEADESSTDDESDAASLTSRSFGDKSDVAETRLGEDLQDVPPPPSGKHEDVDEDDEVSVGNVSRPMMAGVDLPEDKEELPPVETQNVQPLQPQRGITPPQQFVMPEHERRFNVNCMTPIEERTETSIFQHSQDESSFLQSPLGDSLRFRRPPPQQEQPCTPLRQNRSIQNLGSSPFEEYIPKQRSLPTVKKPPIPAKRPTTTTSEKPPTGPIIREEQCNPQDYAIQNQIFDNLRPAIDTYEGFVSAETETFNKVPSIEKFIRTLSSKENGATTQISEMRIQLGETEYLIRKKLGQGAYAPVFLAECARTGQLRAIKVEKSPPRKWEFYLMRQAKRRLGVSRAATGMIHALGLHLFQDESYLILEYRDQGTLLGLVNFVKVSPIGGETTGVMDEVLAMFFTVELLRTVEGLHARGILHGDLKPDNCLLRLDEGDLTVPYRRDGYGGWSQKGIALIDFGRGIDMKLFPENVRFIADWKTDEQDCPEMREMRPWTHQVDYWGLAGIIHSMLFGKYISVRWEPMGTGKKRWFLREGLKRYWQGELWREVLDVLMNPGLVMAEEVGLPVPLRLKECREKMETWLEENSERGMGLRTMIRRIESSRKP